MLTPDLGCPNSSTWTAATHPSMQEAAHTEGGASCRLPCVDSFMDGCVVVVVTEAVAAAVAVAAGDIFVILLTKVSDSHEAV